MLLLCLGESVAEALGGARMTRALFAGSSNRLSRLITASVLSLSFGLVGCAGSGYYVVAGPPPPLRAELVVSSPGVAYAWVPGYWGWSSGNYVWVGGGWRIPPRRGAIWIAPHHEARGHGWVYVRGYWR
jgi:hypothetical protein